MKYARYGEYKASPMTWLDRLPTHWDVFAIKRKYKVINGGTPSSGEEEYWDGGITWLTPEDLGKNTSKTIGTSRRQISREGLTNCGASKTPPGSIVLSTRAPIGHLAITETESTTNQGARILVPRSVDACVDFHYYALLASKAVLQAAGKGTTFLELSAGQLGLHPIPIPPIEEQRVIARFLDAKTAQIDALVAQKRQLIAKLKEKRSALIARTVTRGLPPEAAKAAGLEPHPEMKDSGVEWIGQIPESWCVVPFKRRARFIEGPGIMAADFMDEGVPLIRISGLAGKYVSLEGANYLDPDLVSLRWAHFKTKLGDLLISGSASTGLCCEVESSMVGCIPYTGIIIIRAIQKRSCNDFLRWYFQSDQFLTQVFLLKTGSTIQHFGPSHLAKMTIAVPGGLDEQRAIAEFLDRATVEIDSMVAAVEAAIERLVECRQALITSAVTGKIDVRDWQSEQEAA